MGTAANNWLNEHRDCCTIVIEKCDQILENLPSTDMRQIKTHGSDGAKKKQAYVTNQ